MEEIMRYLKCVIVSLCVWMVLQTNVYAEESKMVISRDSAVQVRINQGGLDESYQTSIETLEKSLEKVKKNISLQLSSNLYFFSQLSYLDGESHLGLVSSIEQQQDALNQLKLMQIDLERQITLKKLEYKYIEKQAYEEVDQLLRPLLKLKKKLNIQSDYESLILEISKNAEKKYSLGEISKLALKEAQINYAITVEQNKLLAIEYENLELSLKKLLNINVQQEVEWKESYRVLVPKTLPDIDDYIDNRVENDLLLESLRIQLEFEDQKKGIYHQMYYNPTEKERGYLVKAQLDEAIESRKNDIIIGTETEYRDIQNKKDLWLHEKKVLEKVKAKGLVVSQKYLLNSATDYDLRYSEWEIESQFDDTMTAYSDYVYSIDAFLRKWNVKETVKSEK